MVAARPLKAGSRIAAADIAYKRPGTGIGPEELRHVEGRQLLRDLSPDDELEWGDLA